LALCIFTAYNRWMNFKIVVTCILGMALLIWAFSAYQNLQDRKITKMHLDLFNIELPKSFHEELPKNYNWEQDNEPSLPMAERIRRRPFTDLRPNQNVITYYLLNKDYYNFGGRQIPVLLRVSLFRQNSAIQSIESYLNEIGQIGFHYDGGGSLAQRKFEEVSPQLLYSGEISESEVKDMHFILTDPVKKVRFFLSVSKKEMSKNEAIEFLQQMAKSVQLDDVQIEKYFKNVEYYLQNKAELQKKNFEHNLQLFNDQLKASQLPLLTQNDWYIDVGRYVYAIEGYEGNRHISFYVRLGSKLLAQKRENTQFYNSGSLAGVLDYPFLRKDEILRLSFSSRNIYFPEQDSKNLDLKRIFSETNAAAVKEKLQLPQVLTAAVWKQIPVSNLDQYVKPGQKVNYVNYLGIKSSVESKDEMVFWLTTTHESTYFSLDPKLGGLVKQDFLGKHFEFEIAALKSGQLSYSLH
jgi:hypothetical protein